MKETAAEETRRTKTHGVAVCYEKYAKKSAEPQGEKLDPFG